MAERETMRRVAAMIGAVAVGMTAMVGASSAAVAAPQGYGNIDESRTGSLTVHKYLHQDGSVTGDISEAPAPGTFTEPVKDVQFTAYPLIKAGESDPLDLTVQANWNDLSDLVPGANCTAPAGFTLGDGTPFPLTDADGAATLSLSLGAYQVCETDAPANIVDRANPFIVTIPTPHENGWVYDVHAYPKNGATELVKTIEAQEGFGLGSSVKFPVSTTLPQMTNEGLTAYAITDTLDSRLSPNAANNGVASVKVGGTDVDTDHYTVSVSGQTIIVEFTTAGLAFLEANAGEQLVIVFDGIVTEVGDGTIENTADLWVNNPSRDENVRPKIPSNEVHTNWGSLEVSKVAAGTTTGLQGAKFEVYAAVDPYADDCSAAEPTGAPIAVDGVTEFESNASGVVAIPGLFVSDSENPVIDAEERCYVLKEVAAPAGYVLPQGEAAFTGVGVKIGQTTVADNIAIENTQQTVPGLPITGGNGTIALIAAGIGGAAVALGLALMKRRRSEVDAA